MEGRAIARPNTLARAARPGLARLLQWRAGQLPGQTWNEEARMDTTFTLQWRGRAIARPNIPFQLGHHREHPASMEGRAIAGQTPTTGACSGQRSPSFNGGPGNCPAKRAGRRPDWRRRSCFNGGPGNCPAKHTGGFSKITSGKSLQWRAGQLPAKQVQPREVGQCACASMEGRAIARPNSVPPPRTATPPTCFNGGPGNCPAKRLCARFHVAANRLQWRAGQLPGQT